MQLVWTRRVLAAAAAAAVVGLIAVPAGTAKDPLPEGGAVKQQEADMKFLKEWVDQGVKNPKAAKKSLDPVRTTAILIAQSAQNRMGGKDDEQLAGLRDQMVKLSDALSDFENPDWKAAAAALEGVKGAKGKKDPVKLHEVKEYELATLMNVFKKADRGGRGWENDLTEMATGKMNVTADKVLEISQGTHLVGQLAEHLAPAGQPAAKKKQWDDFVKGMQTASSEAAAEAVKGAKADAAALKKKVVAMEANCVACHKVFKQ